MQAAESAGVGRWKALGGFGRKCRLSAPPVLTMVWGAAPLLLIRRSDVIRNLRDKGTAEGGQRTDSGQDRRSCAHPRSYAGFLSVWSVSSSGAREAAPPGLRRDRGWCGRILKRWEPHDRRVASTSTGEGADLLCKHRSANWGVVTFWLKTLGQYRQATARELGV